MLFSYVNDILNTEPSVSTFAHLDLLTSMYLPFGGLNRYAI